MILRVPLILLLSALEPSDAWVVRTGVPSSHRGVTTSITKVTGRARRDPSAPSATTALLPRRTTTAKATPTAMLLRMTKNPLSDDGVDDEDEDCDDEEECEIDWDKMMPPTDTATTAFDDEDYDSSSSLQSIKERLERQFAASSSATAAAETEAASPSSSSSIPVIERRGDSRQPVTGATLRNRLEMQWQVAEHNNARDDGGECDVYRPATCGGQGCSQCQGRGRCACRFCRGARTLQLTTVRDDGSVERATVECQICGAAGWETCQPCRGTGWIADWTGIGGGGVHAGGGNGNGRMP